MGKLSVSEVNSMRDEQFEWVFRNVIELRPAAAACVREQRPFTDASDLCAAFHKYLDELSVECGGTRIINEKVEKKETWFRLTICDVMLKDLRNQRKLQVLKSHPDLAGRLAAEGELTQESTEEQRKAGLNELTVEQKAVMDSRNERYKKKFGFPFIICARENKIQSIIEGLNTRYNNILEQEIQIGIHEVKKICKLRILDIVS